MKNLLSIALIALVFVVTSCSKEAKLNRKIDGEWNVVKVDGVALEEGESYTFKFEKDKKGTGDVTMTIADSGFSFALPGTYTLTEDKSIAMMLTFWGETESYVYTVNDYSKKSLKMTDSEGAVYELEKK